MIHRPVVSGAWLLCGILAVGSAGAAQLTERQQRDAASHFREGMNALTSERFDNAESEFRSAVKIDPLFDAAFYGLGQVYMATKRYERAVEAYLDAREAFKKSTAADALDATATDRRLQDQIQALKDSQRMLSRMSQVNQTQNIQAGLARLDEQIRQLESRRGRKMGSVPPPVPAGMSMALGSAYFRLNKLTDAEREYRAAIEVDPAFGEAHNNLAVVYMITERFDQADGEVKLAEKHGFKVNPQFKEDLKRRRGSNEDNASFVGAGL
jgi:tetratricopeptide (TPR) repeat protein